eukprot:gnl/Hemi2/23020_TR7706_c0_g1_i2.p1 gnl/Hemi2/23020_TR7706_c0_g1~~gnl/Hemi2/23020_TR7706_c0_g1_i2.p1  ORF type:complete len:741 (+),score=278.60 gnl/Hemi2/23020_TR7706_c0_g1_i2:89-2311(+)
MLPRANDPPKKPMFRAAQTSHVANEEYAEKTWLTIKAAIREIHSQNASNLSFEELYRNAYNMVLHKYGEILYNGLTGCIRDHLDSIARIVEDQLDDTFLSEMNKRWSFHKTSLVMIRDILMYMDKTHVTLNKKLTVYDLGMKLFTDIVIRAPKIQKRLLNTLLGFIHRERHGEVIDKALMKGTTQMLFDLGPDVYRVEFEDPYLEASQVFYAQEGQEFISSCNCPDYMKKVESRINEEIQRVDNYLDPTSKPKIKEVSEAKLIADHLDTLSKMDSGCISMLRDDKIDDLKRMYDLLRRVPRGLDHMRDTLHTFLLGLGTTLVQDPAFAKDPVPYVQGLLDLRDKFVKIISGACKTDKGEDDKNFITTMNKAFETFVNMNSRSQEFLSLFLDDKLRRSFKGVSEDDIDKVLDKVIAVFRYVRDKDVFERYFKMHLSKRLLTAKSLSDDSERSLIAKLKTECGYQFTAKLEGMFADIQSSSDTMANFRTHLSNQDRRMPTELNVQVLTTGSWPQSNIPQSNLPPELTACCEMFSAYYLSTHNGRRLTWQTSMGTADLKASCFKEKHELNVSTGQCVVLMLFNQHERITTAEMQAASAIPMPDLHRILASLTTSKYPLLNREGSTGTSIQDSDVFSLNREFSTKRTKLQIPVGSRKEVVDQDVGATKAKLDEDRKNYIEAAIVRVMKARKTFEHNNLIAEVTKQLSSRFMPPPTQVKQRIESLIEREYLERSQQDRRVYQYIA